MDHKKGCSQSKLEDILVNREWVVRSSPFRHLLAQEVFKPDYYERLEEAYRALLKKGVAETFDQSRFSRNMKKYDAYGYCFYSAECGPFEVFFEQEWHDLFVRIFDIPPSQDVEVCLHHHKPGGLSGSIHNDLNPSWFPEKNSGSITVATDCHTRPHKPPLPGEKHRIVMRGIAIIFFVNNEPWSPGDGGETGFYTFSDQPVDEPDFAVPPRNNTLLAFECTPFSYHSFISNVNRPRNSIIMWIHREFDEAIRTWGEENVVWWDK